MKVARICVSVCWGVPPVYARIWVADKRRNNSALLYFKSIFRVYREQHRNRDYLRRNLPGQE